MERTYLKGTGLSVSRLCLGTMTFGGKMSEKDAIHMTHCALDAGIDFVDTANVYFDSISETITGKALKGRRDKVTLATKVGQTWGGDLRSGGLSRRTIIEQVEGSLKRLQTDYLDLYYLHVPDYHTPLEETMEAMNALVKSGKVRYIGISNYEAWQMSEIRHLCKEQHFVPPTVAQVVLNPITRGIEHEMVPYTRASGMGVIIYNPLAAGLLSGRYRNHDESAGIRFATNKGYHDRYWTEKNLKAMDRLQLAADAEGISLAQLALKWCCDRDYVDVVLTGFSSEAQLMENIETVEAAPLSARAEEACEAVWQELGGDRFHYGR